MSRDRILAAIRNSQPERLPLPEKFSFESVFDDLPAQFAAVLATVGGQAVSVNDYAEIEAHLRTAYAGVTNIATTLPQLAHLSDVDLAAVTDPHGLAGLNLAVIEGQLGVAENAAIWLDERNLPHRALPMITQYLAIVVRRSDLVPNMHDAYRRLDVAATGFGTFLSGPSKTADIEQSLVVGAHGARGLVVYLLP
ncbi:MAG: LUD domain-containing protein [Cytophagales bacterium]|jgi:L-lactate dehydrogenase complex protein LldG|nr:LUD domain-containing protein [Cytophagales bacterium]